MVDSLRASDSVGDAGANIFCTYMAFEFGLLHELGRLLTSAAEKQMAAGGMEAVGEFANGAETGGVDGGHVTQTENDNGWEGVDVAGDFIDLVGRTEKKWSMNTVDDGVIRNVLTLKHVDRAVGNVIARDTGDGGGTGNFANVREGGYEHTDLDGEGQVGSDGKRQCEKPDGDVGPRVL